MICRLIICRIQCVRLHRLLAELAIYVSVITQAGGQLSNVESPSQRRRVAVDMCFYYRLLVVGQPAATNRKSYQRYWLDPSPYICTAASCHCCFQDTTARDRRRSPSHTTAALPVVVCNAVMRCAVSSSQCPKAPRGDTASAAALQQCVQHATDVNRAGPYRHRGTVLV